MKKRKQYRLNQRRREPAKGPTPKPVDAKPDVTELVPVAYPVATVVGRRPVTWNSVITYVILGVTISLALVSAKVRFEHTKWGAVVEQRTYGMLTTILPQYRPDGPEVVIVDIGDIGGGTENKSDGSIVPTPRAQLRAILETLVQLRPRSIGVDIDFSPTPGGWVDDRDPEFFKSCLELSRATPITLGVFRTLREPKSVWLGLPEYASLAGGMWLPPSGLERTPAWTRAPGVADKLPSLGAKVAVAHAGDVSEQLEETGWLRRFRERTEQTSLRPDGLQVGEVLTNHSAVDQLKREAIRISKAQDLWAHRETIEGRIVLVGVNASALDRFPVPTHDMNLPGIVVHASNAYTLAAEPVWEFSPGARYIIDFALSGALIVAALWLQRGRYSRSKGDVERSERRALFWLIFTTLAACASAVYVFRVLWLDFVLVAISLWLHPKVAAFLHRWEVRLSTWRTEIVTR